MNARREFRVLIVDDDGQLSEIICAALRMCSIMPSVVGTFGAAMVEVKRIGFDLVLLDLTLPDSSPERTIASVGKLLALGARTVAILTGSVMINQRVEQLCISAGAQAVLSKTNPDLIPQIRQLLGCPFAR